ncbi:unnamed protein product [Sphagnum balticum]
MMLGRVTTIMGIREVMITQSTILHAQRPPIILLAQLNLAVEAIIQVVEAIIQVVEATHHVEDTHLVEERRVAAEEGEAAAEEGEVVAEGGTDL